MALRPEQMMLRALIMLLGAIYPTSRCIIQNFCTKPKPLIILRFFCAKMRCIMRG